jgi:tetratricopeptide (TPR) repeat protein
MVSMKSELQSAGLLVWCLSLATSALGAETNLLTVEPKAAVRSSLPTAQALAAQHEQAGRKREAAALYEEMARTNTAARKVLSHRLVTIYTETGETNKAMTWAREVMKDNPDPPAYLAAVHARLGQWKDAENILEQEIARNTNATRAVTLRWQLAEVFEKTGEIVKARKVLDEAADAAKGTAMEATTQRRLKTLNGGTR